MRMIVKLLPCVAAAALLAACDAAGGPVEAPATSATTTAPASSPYAVRERAERGKKLFVAECAGCHGERGRGDGPGAAGLDPRPRDFVKEPFKFRSTGYGSPPTRQDVHDTLLAGIPGTGMPAFGFLAEEERSLLVEHVLSLSRADGRETPAPMQLGPETQSDAASVARGRRVYERLECAKCHGPEGRGDGPSAPTLRDSTGRPTSARDLTNGVFRRGRNATEIHMRFRTGLSGTPMPAYDSLMSQDEGWDLTHYIQSIVARPEPMPTDPVARGRRVVQDKRCDACHVVEGKGGKVGPSLDVAAKKLRYDWAAQFLKDPRAEGKIYPYIPYRMPDLGLTDDEVQSVIALFGHIAGRDPKAPVATYQPDPAKIADGTLLYFLKCTECHNLGRVIPLFEAKRQGPDLIDVSRRLVPEFVAEWIVSPQRVDTDTRMVDPNLTDEQIEAVRAFIWKTSVDAQKP